MASAMGFGDNTKATLITRGLAETARLGVRLGADQLTFAGLAGLGDLVATCSSPLSRNRTFGEHLGRGETLEQAQAATRQTAEGVKSCLAIRDLARRCDVEMPITEQVERDCHESVNPRVAVTALMSRETKPEGPATGPERRRDAAPRVRLEPGASRGWDVGEIRAVAAAAHDAGALLAGDSTAATPLGQQPLALGADLVVASGTKALTGHSDVLLGYVAAADVSEIRSWRDHTGAVPGP